MFNTTLPESRAKRMRKARNEEVRFLRVVAVVVVVVE